MVYIDRRFLRAEDDAVFRIYVIYIRIFSSLECNSTFGWFLAHILPQFIKNPDVLHKF